MNAIDVMKQALEAHQALRDWIEAVPQETQLPAMPGCDGDWLDGVESALSQAIDKAEKQEPVAVVGDGFQLLWARHDWSRGIKVGDKLYAAPQAAQPTEQVAAERERCAKVCESLEHAFADARLDPAEFAAAIRAIPAEPVSCGYDETTGSCTRDPCCYTAPQAQPSASVTDAATVAGLESSIGILSTLVDQQRALLVEVESVFGMDDSGYEYEAGECPLIDRVREHLFGTTAPPAAQQEPDSLHLAAMDLARKQAARIAELEDQLAARVPLTNEQIAGIVFEMNGNEPTGIFWRDLVRAIEAAHGITKGEA